MYIYVHLCATHIREVKVKVVEKTQAEQINETSELTPNNLVTRTIVFYRPVKKEK